MNNFYVGLDISLLDNDWQFLSYLGTTYSQKTNPIKNSNGNQFDSYQHFLY